ncbi:hypothetical protein AT959_14890 [Dechloromonas denitrificans]|uniref:Uncharacterized protein n=1 Tax=Dechloromonas denitrificans TaxID=281362 RepID=A0A133XE96_9RHOO|nr:hypothetical protein [Dechloromonas denitrificans]KXB29260.1 hypothetical protein AT959_14890 [Dechloromonas denitrificans]
MTTHITRSDRRLKLLSTEESHKAGNYDAEVLLVALRNIEQGHDAAGLLANALNGITTLATENRTKESIERLDGFCAIIGPVLERTVALEAKCALLSASLNQADRVAQASADERRAIHAAISTCSQVSAGRIIAAYPNDDDAIVTLCELQLAVRALELKFTDSEGGEI